MIANVQIEGQAASSLPLSNVGLGLIVTTLNYSIATDSKAR